MTWNSSPTLLDRVFAALPYILAITAGLPYGVFVMQEIPAIQVLLLPIAPLLQLYMGLQRSIPFFGLIVFFALILLVVRNENISRFIRFSFGGGDTGGAVGSSRTKATHATGKAPSVWPLKGDGLAMEALWGVVG